MKSLQPYYLFLIFLSCASGVPAQNQLQLARGAKNILAAVKTKRPLSIYAPADRLQVVDPGGEAHSLDPITGFQPAGPLPPPEMPGGYLIDRVVDVNGDGHLDLILRNRSANPTAIGLLLNDKAGRFPIRGFRYTPLGEIPLFAYETLVIDLDGDGHLDLALWLNQPLFTAQNKPLYLLLNDGFGNFIRPSPDPPAVPAFPGVLAKGDFDEDGLEDIVVGVGGRSMPHGQAHLWLSGRNQFLRDGGPLPCPTACTHAIAVGDVDGDGHLDLVLGNTLSQVSAQNQLLLGDGKGGFRNVTATHLPVREDPTIGLVFADFDGDCRLDLALLDASVTTAGASPVRVLRNDGKGRFLDELAVEALGPGLYDELQALDLDGTGFPDIAVFNRQVGWIPLMNRARRVNAPHPPRPGSLYTTEWYALSPGPPRWHVAIPMVSAGTGNQGFPWLSGHFDLDPSLMTVCNPLLIAYRLSSRWEILVPNDPALRGRPVYIQGLVLDDLVYPSGRWGFTNSMGDLVQ